MHSTRAFLYVYLAVACDYEFIRQRSLKMFYKQFITDLHWNANEIIGFLKNANAIGFRSQKNFFTKRTKL